MAVGMKLRSGKILRNYPKQKRSNFKKAVTAIAKRAVMTQAETKTAVVTHNVSYGSSGTFSGGLWNAITQGTAQQNRIGDEITSLGIKIRGINLLDPSVVTGGREHSGVRMMVVSGKRPLTSGDMPQFKGAVDPEALTVLYDKYIKFNTTNLAHFLNRYIKFKRVVKYAGAVPTRNEIYVWLIPAPVGTGLTTTTGYSCNIDFQLYYKDV